MHALKLPVNFRCRCITRALVLLWLASSQSNEVRGSSLKSLHNAVATYRLTWKQLLPYCQQGLKIDIPRAAGWQVLAALRLTVFGSMRQRQAKSNLASAPS